MDNSPKLVIPLSKKRSHSQILLNVEELENTEMYKKCRSLSTSKLQEDTRNHTKMSYWSVKLLYRSTDTILVLCALIFIISSISSIILWMYGLNWVKNQSILKQQNFSNSEYMGDLNLMKMI